MVLFSFLFAGKKEAQRREATEELLYEQRSKLYRFQDGEWKEKGLGLACLLRDTETSAVRFLMTDEKTRKVLANHSVANTPPYCKLLPGVIDRTWLWLAQNQAEDGGGKVVDEKLGLKLGSKELAQKFEMAWNAALEIAGCSEKKASASFEEKSSEPSEEKALISFEENPSATSEKQASEEQELEEEARLTPMLGVITNSDASMTNKDIATSGQQAVASATPEWLAALGNIKLAGLRQIIDAEGFTEVSKAVGGKNKRTLEDIRNDIRTAYAARNPPRTINSDDLKGVKKADVAANPSYAATKSAKLSDGDRGLFKIAFSVLATAVVHVIYLQATAVHAFGKELTS